MVYLLTEVFLFALFRSCLLYMLFYIFFMCQKYLTFLEKAKNVMLKDVVKDTVKLLINKPRIVRLALLTSYSYTFYQILLLRINLNGSIVISHYFLSIVIFLI